MVDKDRHNPYAGIIMGGDSLDRELLGQTIRHRVEIYNVDDQPEIVITGDLTVRQQLLVYLLARKVLKDAGKIDQEGISPSEIEKETRIPGGTIRPYLKKLSDARLVQAKDGLYFVPNHALQKVSNELKGKEE